MTKVVRVERHFCMSMSECRTPLIIFWESMLQPAFTVTTSAHMHSAAKQSFSTA